MSKNDRGGGCTAPSAGGLAFLPAVKGRVHWVHSASLSLLRFLADLSTAPQLPRSNARLWIHSAVCDRCQICFIYSEQKWQIRMNKIWSVAGHGTTERAFCPLQEMVDWFNAIRAARFHYLQVAFPGASDEEVRMVWFKHAHRCYWAYSLKKINSILRGVCSWCFSKPAWQSWRLWSHCTCPCWNKGSF